MSESKFQIFYPNVYSEDEQAAIDAYDKAPKDEMQAPGGRRKVLDDYTFETAVKNADPYNPLFNDEEYAKGTKYGVPISPPLVFGGEAGSFAGISIPELGTEWYYSNDGGEVTFHAPIKKGDTLTGEQGEQTYFDITPAEGSDFRTFRLIGGGTTRNQHGEIVCTNKAYGKNAFRRDLNAPEGTPLKTMHFKPDPNKKSNTSLGVWVDPPVYTSEGWDRVFNLWNQEVIRGANTLYWEDVNIGDSPSPVSSGPVTIFDLVQYGAMGGQNKIEMYKNRAKEMGIVIDKYNCYHGLGERHYGHGGVEGDLGGPIGGYQRSFVLRMLTNYIGDDGWIYNIRWWQPNHHIEIETGEEEVAELFANVPSLKGKPCDMVGSMGEDFIGRGYVYKKYIDGEAHKIDMVCWLEGFDGKVNNPMHVTVILPSKEK